MVVVNILIGVVVVLLLTAATGYFVAQEFGYMAVDRSRLKARAADGDRGAERALGITRRTSFMLSGAQLGITVTGLLVGYVAEPMIGAGIGTLLGGVGVPQAVGVAVGTVLALLFSTLVQMLFGELFPKNLAIAEPEPVARGLAFSTRVYLAAFGWLIHLFDKASNLLLKVLHIEPVHDVEHAATPRDLEHIVAESRETGDLSRDLSILLDRVLELNDRTAEHAMIPRPQVTAISGEATVHEAIELMAGGHSRLPVLGESVDDVLGVLWLRDVLDRDEAEFGTLTVHELTRDAVVVPASLPLPGVLAQLRAADDEFACVMDEYGGLAGVITLEDIAEEVVGEITDEHDAANEDRVIAEDGGWVLPGSTHVDEVERLLGRDLPDGDYQTISGLVISELERLPEPGDTVQVTLAASPPDEDRRVTVVVREVERHVPALLWVGVDTGAEVAR
ncbi:hemolysin family protein [Amycolatopsis magusensis]|uniref:hemolysin family protein n=1 Tax=Amycolatopsis magusensis TaxID=882444 RepID=UPI003C2CC0F9